MPVTRSNKRMSIVNEIKDVVLAKASKSERPLVSKFVERYYSNIAIEDLESSSVVDLAGAVHTHWQLLNNRSGDDVGIRIFNPSREVDGWQSASTVIMVVVRDMPFLVDSIRMEVNRHGFMTHFLVNLGGVHLTRDGSGRVTEILSGEQGQEGEGVEAPIFIELDRQIDRVMRDKLEGDIRRVLRDVRLAVEDWPEMRSKMKEALSGLESLPDRFKDSEFEETLAFLRWLLDHFIFLGFRHYRLDSAGGDMTLRATPRSGLGVLRNGRVQASTSKYFMNISPQSKKKGLAALPIIVSKTKSRSTVHRPTYTDFIGVEEFNQTGQVIGEWRFIGLYTSEAYNRDPSSIPLLRRKLMRVMERSGMPIGSYAGNKLSNILKTLPRDDLFQATENELYRLSLDIFRLEEQERRQISLFVRRDHYGRFFSCLVYMPRDYFSTDLIGRIEQTLKDAFRGLDVKFSPYFPASNLVRVHYVVRVDPKQECEYDVRAIEKKLMEIGYAWRDAFLDQLQKNFGLHEGNRLYNRYTRSFPAGYREIFSPFEAAKDVACIEALLAGAPLQTRFYEPEGQKYVCIRYKLFSLTRPVALSDALPMMENMGLRIGDEHAYKVSLPTGERVWVNDFGILHSENHAEFDAASMSLFQEAFHRIWSGDAENDGFNRLILSAGIDWYQTNMLRTYSRYYRQVLAPFSQEYIQQALLNNADISRLLVELFELRFDPTKQTTRVEKRRSALVDAIHHQLDDVVNLDEDRIVRWMMQAILATLRTNYYQFSDESTPPKYLTLKLHPCEIPDLPRPLPKFEVFTCSPRFEGVHLRAGSVARGGIRWSDRREDFRTEILGLMKAQKVKNALIVPAGAKGGFVPKNLPVDKGREAVFAEGLECYKLYISSLLDITDNYDKNKIVQPENTVCYDAPDPYLVVAADKGTATFSDTANAIATERDYWLSDAFASGGSSGYDHKKMAITARGAWESVEHHFYELDVDIHKQDFTVVGIGDMGGDVFGNGMLLSKHIKLVAAFNHMHIFLDPDPNAAQSFTERQRLFELPNSTWEDYDKKLISKGGGVFSRLSKSIRLSAEMKRVLDTEKTVMTPNELIKELLMAPVDLLWNGGIGTYVKGSSETHTQVGDRANDSLRVNGGELRCRIIGEGGNLGLTQLGRVEFELHGGRVNTDFIDNSAGVDCSDHEVNIKILLNRVVLDKQITIRQRNQLLVKMTDDVASLVLRNNRLQNTAISLAVAQVQNYVNLYDRYIVELEKSGVLDRALEYLPSSEMMKERKASGVGLTRPELSVLLAYTKIMVKESILASDLADNQHIASYVKNAFPGVLSVRYAKEMTTHRLRSQIVATQLSNALVNDMGITFVHQMRDEMGVTIPEVVCAYVISRSIFDMPLLLQSVEKVGMSVTSDVKTKMLLEIHGLVRRGARWFLRNRRACLDIETNVEQFSGHVGMLSAALPGMLVGEGQQNYQARQDMFEHAGVPTSLSARLASSSFMHMVLNIIEAASSKPGNIMKLAEIYSPLVEYLGFSWLRDQINAYPVDSRWTVLARASLKDDLERQLRAVLRSVLVLQGRFSDGEARLTSWCETNEAFVARWLETLEGLRAYNAVEFTMLTVAVRDLQAFSEITD